MVCSQWYSRKEVPVNVKKVKITQYNHNSKLYSSIYLYTGVEAQYGIGPLKILPSFTPGYYEKGEGKDLGSVLEFKSEIKLGFDIFENSKLSYSYSHISNNDWGDTNPGTDNQQITFSQNF